MVAMDGCTMQKEVGDTTIGDLFYSIYTSEIFLMGDVVM